jgi:hypothetical protein
MTRGFAMVVMMMTTMAVAGLWPRGVVQKEENTIH